MTSVRQLLGLLNNVRDLNRRVRLLETVDPPLIAPQQAPDVFVVGGAGYLTVTWPEVQYASEYEVYLSEDFDFAPSEDTLSHVTPSTLTTLRVMPDGAALKYNKPYYVKVLPRNEAGKPFEAPNNPGAALQLQDQDIESISADKITAGEIKSGVLVSGRIYSPDYEGWRVEIGDTDFPIRYWDGEEVHFSVGASGEIFIASQGAWRVEIGDIDFPLRYWDGQDTHFSVDASGNSFMAGHLDVFEDVTDSVALRVRTVFGSTEPLVRFGGDFESWLPDFDFRLRTSGDAPGKFQLRGQSVIELWDDSNVSYSEFPLMQIGTFHIGEFGDGEGFGIAFAEPGSPFPWENGDLSMSIKALGNRVISFNHPIFSAGSGVKLRLHEHDFNNRPVASYNVGSGEVELYVDITAGGKTRLMIAGPSGAPVALYTEP